MRILERYTHYHEMKFYFCRIWKEMIELIKRRNDVDILAKESWVESK